MSKRVSIEYFVFWVFNDLDWGGVVRLCIYGELY